MTSAGPGAADKDYLLGTHDEEIERLALQHRVWRPRVLDAWRRAGFTEGQRILDVGCGPGNASVDLAEIVGPKGVVCAIDQSRRFLDVLEARSRALRLGQVNAVLQDLESGALPLQRASGAWVRWVFAFLRNPRDLVLRLADALAPGGVLVTHEYLDYSTWRLAPRLPEIEEFVEQVMIGWREAGGEPDIGLELPGWLAEAGFQVKECRPLIEVVDAENYVWQWPKAFIRVGVARMIDLKRLTPERGEAIISAFEERERKPHTLMITPLVLEIIATRK